MPVSSWSLSYPARVMQVPDRYLPSQWQLGMLSRRLDRLPGYLHSHVDLPLDTQDRSLVQLLHFITSDLGDCHLLAAMLPILTFELGYLHRPCKASWGYPSLMPRLRLPCWKRWLILLALCGYCSAVSTAEWPSAGMGSHASPEISYRCWTGLPG